MRISNVKIAVATIAFTLSALTASVATNAQDQSGTVDPAATQILQRMTDYLGNLKKLSVHTQNTVEDVLDSGHRVDFDISTTVTIRRPNKIHAVRKGEMIDQDFYYDGKTITLYNPSDKVYASEAAPGTFEELFKFMFESLGFHVLPVTDLVYSNAFPLLMQDVTYAVVIGKTFINGVKCDHVLFSRLGVDFQVWIADSGRPLPYKYVVTDTGIHSRLSTATIMSDWNLDPAVDDDRFTFVPPQGVKQISFMPF